MKKIYALSAIFLSLNSSAMSEEIISDTFITSLDTSEIVHFDPHMKADQGETMAPFMQAILSLNQECFYFDGIDYMDQLCEKVGEIVNDENNMTFPVLYSIEDLKKLPVNLSPSQVETLENWGPSIQAVFEQHVLSRESCPDNKVCMRPVEKGKIYIFPKVPA